MPLTYEERENKLRERSQRLDSENLSYQEYIALQFNELGEECQADGEHDRAISCFAQGAALYGRILEKDPTNLDYKEGFGHSHLLKAESHTDISEYVEALDALEVGDRVFRECLELESENLKFKAGIALACTLFSQSYLALGRPEQAWQANEEGVAQWRRLCKEWPDEQDCRLGLAGVLLLSMEIGQDPAKKGIVIQHLQEGYELMERFSRVASRDNVAEAQKVLTTFALAIGIHHIEGLSDTAKGKQYLLEAESLAEILLLETPLDMEMRMIQEGIRDALDDLGY